MSSRASRTRSWRGWPGRGPRRSPNSSSPPHPPPRGPPPSRTATPPGPRRGPPPARKKIILEGASGGPAGGTGGVGRPLDQALPASGTAAAVPVVLPDGQAVPAKLQASGGVSQLHFEKPELSGAYQVKVGPPLALESTFAANPDPAESDPAKLDRAGLAEALPGWSFAYLTHSQDLTG